MTDEERYGVPAGYEFVRVGLKGPGDSWISQCTDPGEVKSGYSSFMKHEVRVIVRECDGES